MKEIPLTQGKVAYVDDDDYTELSKHKWFADNYSGTFYAGRNRKEPNGKRPKVFMHRVILGLVRGDGKQADHINHDGLDNRKENLRVCTAQQNRFNMRKKKNTTSRYRGVTWTKGKWKARIFFNYKQISLGVFADEIDAARAYDEKAREMFGEFANTNFKLKGLHCENY